MCNFVGIKYYTMNFLETIKNLFGGKASKQTENTFPQDPQAPVVPEPTFADKAGQVAEEISEKAENAAEALKEKAGEIWDKLEPKVEAAKEKAAEVWKDMEPKLEEVKEKAAEVWEKVEPAVDEVKEKAQEVWTATKEKVEEVMDKISDDTDKTADVHQAAEEMSEKFPEDTSANETPAVTGTPEEK